MYIVKREIDSYDRVCCHASDHELIEAKDYEDLVAQYSEGDEVFLTMDSGFINKLNRDRKADEKKQQTEYEQRRQFDRIANPILKEIERIDGAIRRVTNLMDGCDRRINQYNDGLSSDKTDDATKSKLRALINCVISQKEEKRKELTGLQYEWAAATAELERIR